MSVIVQQLSKHYGTQRAVDQISFEAPRGKVTGFLGPNGAGKSTTMKIAVGYVQPTAGEILLDGIAVTKEPLRVKKLTGYLPEHNPLYLEMYVKEFLRFVGSCYGLKGKSLAHRVAEVIALVGLGLEQHKKIGALSKGYRQRIGLAQALIHDPSVLILDEPTTGLDPNQILEIRDVIRNISRDKTVILSTHIMQEVEAICDKVVIIDRGVIVADDELSTLKAQAGSGEGMVLTFEEAVDMQLFVQEGLDVQQHDAMTLLIRSEKPALRAELLRITSENNLPLVSLTKSTQSLESIFHQLTQKDHSRV